MVVSVPYDRSEIADYLRSHRAGLSRYELEILSEAYSSREKSVALHYEPPSPAITLRVGGSLAKVSTGVSAQGGGKPPERMSGDITGFSAGSRRRLMRLIASTDRSAKPLFVTLTLPDEFTEAGSEWKRYVDVFGKRFRREYPDCGFVWRIEFKDRKSGLSAGRVAPHYHLLVWGVELTGFRKWVSTAWYNTVGSGSADHLAAGVQSQRIRRWGGTMSYVSKYIAKTDLSPNGWSGRVWGVVGRGSLPWAVEVVMELPVHIATMAIRLFRKMMKLKGKTLVYGVSIVINVERVLDWLEWVEDDL